MRQTAALVFLQVEYVEAEPGIVCAAAGLCRRRRGRAVAAKMRSAELTLPDGSRIRRGGHEAFAVPAFARALLELIRRRGRLHNAHGEIEATRTAALRQILNGRGDAGSSPSTTRRKATPLFFSATSWC